MRSFSLAFLSILATNSFAHAGVAYSASVGTGDSHSTVQIQFSDGDSYLFDVAWSGTTTGMDLLEIIDASLAEDFFVLTTDDFGWGDFVSGLGVANDYEYGTGDLWPTVENYWHYWTDDIVDGDEDWESSWVGASDHIALDGGWEAWVFISSGEPEAVPAPGALALLALTGANSRRRR